MDVELRIDPDRAPGSGQRDSLLFIGNATMLIRYGGFTILTDPTFVHRHERVDLGHHLSTARRTDPAIELDDLPPIDFVLLSHFHGDHFDQVAQRGLDHGLPIVTTPQSCRQLRGLGFEQAHGIDTWQTATVVKGHRRLRITACPGRHGPGLVDLVLPDVMGSVLQCDEGDISTIYVSGDTLMYRDLAEIPRRFPDVDLGVFHLGGAKILGILVTMDGRQGVEAVRLIDPDVAIPVHYDDYDVFTSPLSDFIDLAGREGLLGRIQVLHRGDTHLLDGTL